MTRVRRGSRASQTPKRSSFYRNKHSGSHLNKDIRKGKFESGSLCLQHRWYKIFSKMREGERGTSFATSNGNNLLL